MRTVPICLLALVTTCALPAIAAFKCTDEKGRTHFEDTLPEACANVVTYELGRSGNVIRKIEPTRAKVDDSADRQKAADDQKAGAERKRRDAMLLNSYGSEREIDSARDRNVDMLKNRLSAAKTTAEKTKQPAERAIADANVTRIEKDIEATQARFAADKARWIELRAAK